MKNKTAFITGISGQDGSYLAEYLLSLGYSVHGTIRRNSTPENQVTRIDHIADKVSTYYADLNDPMNMERLIMEIQPDEIYNLAAQSHVRISFEVPQFTAQTNAVGVLNMLDIFRRLSAIEPDAKFYQASSSEMFGNQIDDDGFQSINTPMIPVSPYGAAKLYAFNMVRIYRESYGLNCYNGILFNHESPRRASNFVTNKIVKTAVMIAHGKQTKLTLGNLGAKRDWGHSRDYVRAMHSILNYTEPGDQIVATGEQYSVRDFCRMVFRKLGMDYREHVVTDSKYMRPNELNALRGKCTLHELVWRPETTIHEMIDEMIAHWELNLT